LRREATQISRFAWAHYRGAPLSVRWLMRLRPRICPLEVVADAVPEGARVLDVGCGAGLLLAWLAEQDLVAAGTGVDTSERAVAIAGRANSDAGLSFVVRRPEEPWPDGPFDLVTAVDVLHHVPPGEQRRFVRRLAASGAPRVLLKDLDPRPRWKRWMNALHDLLMTRRRVHPRPMAEVARWLAEDGLRVTRAERVDRLWYSHYLVEAVGSSLP
jgi:2-polyprenyl-3-methyl-5-hydroxy-6-metoxy-1,4-benzoquinol methylase